MEDSRARTFPLKYQLLRGQTSAAPSTTVAYFAEVNASLGDLSIEVPMTWAGVATLEMSDNFAQVPTPSACPELVIGTSCTPDAVVTATMPVWDPPRPPDHIALCDDALNHRPRLIAAIGQAFAVDLQIDPNLYVNSVDLVYRINEGASETQHLTGTGVSSYNFQIPSSQFGQGDRIDYAFLVSGTHSDPRCAGRTFTQPVNHSYSAIASSSATPDTPGLWQMAGRAMGSAVDQPEYELDTEPQEICNGYFATPTPCDLFPASSVSGVAGPHPLPPAPQIPVRPLAPSQAMSEGCKSYVELSDSNPLHQTLQWYEWVDKQKSNGVLGLTEVVQTRDEAGLNVIRQAAVAQRTMSSGTERAVGVGRVGWRFSIVNLSGEPSNAPYHIEVYYSIRGELSTVGGDHLVVLKALNPPFWPFGIAQRWSATAEYTLSGGYKNFATDLGDTLNGTISGRSSLANWPIDKEQKPVSEGSRMFGWDRTLYDWSPTVQHEYAFFVQFGARSEVSMLGGGLTAAAKTDFVNPASSWQLRVESMRLTSADGSVEFC